jgi:sulfur carrier protein
MRLEVNGKELNAPNNCTVADLLVRLERDTHWIAVAVDRTVIPREKYSSLVLREGQLVEILIPMQGG